MKHYTITRLAATLFIVLSLTGVPMLSSAATAESAQLASILSSFQKIINQLRIILDSPVQAQAPTITIGETTILPIDDSGNGGLLLAQQATLSQTATIQSLSFYVTNAAGQLRLGIYDATGPSGGPGQKKAETNSFIPIVGWNTQNVITPVSLTAGTYWLAYTPSDSALSFKRDGSTGSIAYYSFTYGPMPQTFSTSPITSNDHWSFYGTLTTADITAPSIPAGLSASAISSSQINLSWTASTDNVGVTGYRVERCQGATCTTFAQIATPITNSHSDTGLTANTTYRYQVRATDAAGNLSGYSSIVNGTTQAAAPTITIGETTILPIDDSGNGGLLLAQQATLSQTATIQSLSFYVTNAAGQLRLGIYDATGPSGGPGQKKAETNSFIPIVGWNTQNVITPVSLTAGTYWLAYTPSDSALSFKRDGSTGSIAYYSFTYGPMPQTFSTSPITSNDHWSFYATLNTASPPPPTDTTAPSIPTALSASAISSSQINLSWTASTDNVGVTGYRVERCTGSTCTTFTQIGTPTTNSYQDTGLTAATTYRYRVRATDAAGNLSGYSSIVSATTQPSGGNTITATSCNSADVQTAINSVQDGDTVIIPNGICTWNSGITTSKQIKIKGQTKGVVMLTMGGAITGQDAAMLSVTTGNSFSTEISNLNFLPGTGTGKYIAIGGTGKPPLVHDNYFNIPDFQIVHAIHLMRNGGVFYRNTFESLGVNGSLGSDGSGSGSFDIVSPDASSWSTASTMGATDTDGTANVYIEDNTFKNIYLQAIDCSENARTVIRHNTFNDSAFVCHGADTGLYGARHTEVYDNTFTFSPNGISGGNGLPLALNWWWYIRGGTGVVTGNVMPDIDSGWWGNKSELTFIVQQLHRNAGPDACVSAYPAFHQVGRGLNNTSEPLYVWGNTGTGLPESPGKQDHTPDECGRDYVTFTTANWVQANRDYYTGTAKPGWSRYTYPHPLQGGTPPPPPPTDTMAPSVPANLSATAISSSQINLSWTASTDNVGVTGYRVERCTGSTCTTFAQIGTPTTNSYQDTGLTVATTYRYRVRATDAAGNLSGYSSIVNGTTQAPLDITPPILSAITSSSITSNSAVITWTTDEPATTQVEYGLTASYGNSSTFNPTLTTSHSVSLSSLSSNSLYHYRVKSQDASSNLVTSLDNTFTTSLVPDTQPPATISNLQASNLQTNSFTLNWSSPSDSPSGGSAASYDIRYAINSLSSSNWDTATQVSGEPVPSSPGSSQSYIVAGLSPQTTYQIGIKSQDAAGNISLLSNVVTATTPPIPDTTPPVISSVTVSSVSASTATITWTTDELSDSQVEYGLTTAYGSSSPLNSSLVTSHSITLSSLASGTLYHYRVKSQDAAKNLASSGDLIFTTSVPTPPLDTTPPVISAVQSTNVKSSEATIIWTTDESADSQVEYGLTASYGNATILDSNMVTSHSTALTGLIRKTIYHYRVKSKDALGNLAVSGDNIFTTSDRTPKPPKVTNLQASSGSVILSWTNPTDYEFFRGVVVIKSATGFSLSYNASNLLANTQGESFADQSVTANTTYYYSVFTYDDLGVYSDPVNVSFTPLAPTPTTSGVGIGGSPSPGSTGPSGSSSGGGDGGSILPTPVPTPSNVNIYGAKDQIILTWQNPTDPNFVRVKILRKEKNPSVSPTDGTVIYEGDGKEFTDTQELKSNTVYYYTLFSMDRNLKASSLYSTSGKLGTQTNQEIIEARSRASKTETNVSYDMMTLTQNLYRGLRNADVLNVQTFLIQKGYLDSGKNTSFFGPLTELAIKKFQCAQAIVCSGSPITTGWGNIGPKTRAKINLTSTTQTTTIDIQTLQQKIEELKQKIEDLKKQLQLLQQ